MVELFKISTVIQIFQESSRHFCHELQKVVTYNMILPRRSIYAGSNGLPPPRAARRGIRHISKPCWNYNDRHTHQISQTNLLPVTCISNECINSEALFDFPNQLSPSSLCLLERAHQLLCYFYITRSSC